jgi:hypothetical protein
MANSEDLYAALVGGPKTYMGFNANQIKLDPITSKNYIVDPFGNPYNYYCPLRPATGLVWSNQASFDLWSYGPNGLDDEGTNDDISNWKQN